MPCSSPQCVRYDQIDAVKRYDIAVMPLFETRCIALSYLQPSVDFTLPVFHALDNIRSAATFQPYIVLRQTKRQNYYSIDDYYYYNYYYKTTTSYLPSRSHEPSSLLFGQLLHTPLLLLLRDPTSKHAVVHHLIGRAPSRGVRRRRRDRVRRGARPRR